MNIQDLTGKRFGRLVVIRFCEKRHKTGYYWNCKCDCGNETSVRSGNLTQGKTISCGCLNHKWKKHGKHGTRIYRIWANILARCSNPKQKNYPYYGGRGITVCSEWKDFQTFDEWATANGYEDNLSIDRINNDGNYEPSNCRWTTIKEQANNRSNNISRRTA